jgi:glycosyltransferase involved in cell wall biosynthesis
VKVLTVIDGFALGGAERLLATLAVFGPRAGFELEMVGVRAPEVHGSMEGVPEEAQLTTSSLHAGRFSDIVAVRRLAEVIRRSDCDLVHAHLERASTIAWLAGTMVPRPTVCTFHHPAREIPGPIPAVKEDLAVFGAGRTKGLIFPSKDTWDTFERRYRRRATWALLYNGIDLTEFSTEPAEMPEDLGIPAGAPVAAFVAAFHRRKGHEEALRAWPGVLERVPDARMLLVGTGVEEPNIRRTIDELGIGERVVMAGLRSDVARIIRASTLVLLPSRSEAVPTVLIEAAACGRAIVATNAGGNWEALEDGRSGLLVPLDDVPALTSALVELLGDPSRAKEMGRAGRALAEERFDAWVWAKRLNAVYEGAIAGVPAGETLAVA